MVESAYFEILGVYNDSVLPTLFRKQNMLDNTREKTPNQVIRSVLLVSEPTSPSESYCFYSYCFTRYVGSYSTFI